MSSECSENNYKTSPLELKSEICFTDVAHSKELLSWLHSLRTNEQLCDVVLNVGESKLLCHKAVLASSSPYFHAMFTGLWLSIAVIFDENKEELR